MVFVAETQTFQESQEKYDQFEYRFVQKTREAIRGLRKTLTKQVADEVYNTVQEDLQEDMYSNFLQFACNLWDEALKYVLGEKVYPEKRDGSFAEYAKSLGWKPEDLRKKIYEENKEELTKAITCDYLYDQLGYFFLQSPYWKGIDLKLDGKYTQNQIMKAFMERLASDDKFNDTLEGLVDKRIMDKKAQLRELESQIINLSANLKALIGEEE
jgi:hypothetical protein